MNILHFTYSLTSGGRRNAMINLAKGLELFDVNCYACSMTPLNSSDAEYLKHSSFKNYFSLDATGHYFVQKSKLLNKLREICTDNNIQAIHTHDASSQIITSLLHQNKKTLPHVYTFHRSLSSDTSGLKNILRNYYANKFTDVISVGSNNRKNHLLKKNIFLKNEKIKLIPFGIDINSYKHSKKLRSQLRSKYNISEQAIVLGAIGHFGKEKGIDIVIQAFSEIKKSVGKDLVLIILGKGSEQQISYIEDLIHELNLVNDIVLPGFDSAIAKWYSCFDIFLHAPRMEAFGLVVVEAMASSLPVVASRVGGILDIITHDKNGYLVESSNPSELARYTLNLIENDQKISKFGDHGYELACSRYSLENFSKKYFDLYSSLISGNY